MNSAVAPSIPAPSLAALSNIEPAALDAAGARARGLLLPQGENSRAKRGSACGRRPSAEQRRFHEIVPWFFSPAALVEDGGGRKASFPPPSLRRHYGRGAVCYYTLLYAPPR